MRTRIFVWCIVCSLVGAFIGATIAALYTDTGQALLWGTGIGLVIGAVLGTLLGLPSPAAWAGIGEGLELFGAIAEGVAGILECCSAFAIIFLSFSALITTFIFGHHIWLALMVSVSVAVFLTLALACVVKLGNIQAKTT